MSLNRDEELGFLYDLLIKTFREKLQGKDYQSADLSTIVKFLKDNNITSIPTKDNDLGDFLDVIDELPEDPRTAFEKAFEKN